MRPVRIAALLAAVVVAACTPARHTIREDVQRLSSKADACESFVSFDDELRAVRGALHAGGTTSDLLQLDVKLKLARRKCAFHVLGTLVRERDSGKVQAELDAMARAMDEASLRAMVQSAYGNDPALRARLELAIATSEAERRAAAQARGDDGVLAASRPEVPDASLPLPDGDTDVAMARLCESRPPEEGLSCLGELAERGVSADVVKPSVDALAQRLLDESDPLPPDARSRRIDGFLGKLALVSGAQPPESLLRELRALREKLWPEVQAAAKRSKGRAAWLALPFLRLPGAVEDVQRYVLDAAAEQAEVAQKSEQLLHPRPAALHRLLAAQLTGGTAPALALEPGHWDTTRYACKRPPPALEQPPQGMSLRFVGRCQREAPPPKPPTPSAMKTFELEASLRWERIEGEVIATCEGVHRYPVSVRDVIVEEAASSTLEAEGTGPGQALKVRLESVAREERARCRAAAEKAVPAWCQEISGTTDVYDAEHHFITLALRLGAWPPCFASWFEKTWGLPLPPLRD